MPNKLPSEEYKEFWISIDRKAGKYPKSTDNNGKWMIFAKKGNDLDSIWSEVRKMVENGLLGMRAKVSTMKENPNSVNKDYGVICVYTYDSNDKEDVKKIARQLFTIDLVKKLYYKEDNATYLGLYANRGDKKVSKYVVDRENLEEL